MSWLFKSVRVFAQFLNATQHIAQPLISCFSSKGTQFIRPSEEVERLWLEKISLHSYLESTSTALANVELWKRYHSQSQVNFNKNFPGPLLGDKRFLPKGSLTWEEEGTTNFLVAITGRKRESTNFKVEVITGQWQAQQDRDMFISGYLFIPFPEFPPDIAEKEKDFPVSDVGRSNAILHTVLAGICLGVESKKYKYKYVVTNSLYPQMANYLLYALSCRNLDEDVVQNILLCSQEQGLAPYFQATTDSSWPYIAFRERHLSPAIDDAMVNMIGLIRKKTLIWAQEHKFNSPHPELIKSFARICPSVSINSPSLLRYGLSFMRKKLQLTRNTDAELNFTHRYGVVFQALLSINKYFLSVIECAARHESLGEFNLNNHIDERRIYHNHYIELPPLQMALQERGLHIALAISNLPLFLEINAAAKRLTKSVLYLDFIVEDCSQEVAILCQKAENNTEATSTQDDIWVPIIKKYIFEKCGADFKDFLKHIKSRSEVLKFKQPRPAEILIDLIKRNLI